MRRVENENEKFIKVLVHCSSIHSVGDYNGCTTKSPLQLCATIHPPPLARPPLEPRTKQSPNPPPALTLCRGMERSIKPPPPHPGSLAHISALSIDAGCLQQANRSFMGCNSGRCRGGERRVTDYEVHE